MPNVPFVSIMYVHSTRVYGRIMNFVNLQTLCQLDGVSGREDAVRQEISNQLSSLAQDIRTDVLGNLIAFKKGHTDKNIILCAHMDEVGVIAKYVTDDGFIKFSTVGGINTE